MTSLIDVIKEQTAFGFTGKINLLLKSNGQFQGVIYQQDGIVVGASYGQMNGKRALFKMIFEDVEQSDNFKYIVEPELIAASHFTMKMTLEEIKEEAQRIYQQYLQAKKLKPAMNLRLVIDTQIISNKNEITSDEFDILALLADWCKVEDVYKYSKLMDFEITNALVSLRKKRAIKVFQN